MTTIVSLCRSPVLMARRSTRPSCATHTTLCSPSERSALTGMVAPPTAGACSTVAWNETFNAHVGQNARVQFVEANPHPHGAFLTVGRRNDRNHLARYPPIGVCVQHRLDPLSGRDAMDVILVDVHFNFQRRHVHHRAHARPREPAARRQRRNDFPWLRGLGNDHSRKRSPDHRIVELLLPRRHLALGDDHFDILPRQPAPATNRRPPAPCPNRRPTQTGFWSTPTRAEIRCPPAASCAFVSPSAARATSNCDWASCMLVFKFAGSTCASAWPASTFCPSSNNTSRICPVAFDDTVASRRAVTYPEAFSATCGAPRVIFHRPPPFPRRPRAWLPSRDKTPPRRPR